MADNENNSRLERMMGQMGSLDMEEAGEFIKNVIETTQEPPKRIPENVFREIFLPVFAGLDPAAEKKTQEFAAHWVGIVGSASEPAEVVNVQGDTLFTVPPIFNPDRLNLTSTVVGKDSYKNIFGNLVDNASVNAPQAIAEFSMAASKRLDAALDKKDAVTAANPWTPVFSYYGLIKDGEAESASDNSQQPPLDDDFVF